MTDTITPRFVALPVAVERAGTGTTAACIVDDFCAMRRLVWPLFGIDPVYAIACSPTIYYAVREAIDSVALMQQQRVAVRETGDLSGTNDWRLICVDVAQWRVAVYHVRN